MTREMETEAGGAGGEIARLSTRDRPAGLSALAELEAHWRELKAGARLLPRRGDIDATRIGGALPHAFVLERVAPGVARFRVAGRAIADLLGSEPRDMPLSVLFSRVGRVGLQHWLERCFDGPALVDLMVEAPQGPLRQPLRGRLVLLPLLDEDDQPTRALGGLLLDGVPRRASPRFDLADAVPRVETALPKAIRQKVGEVTGTPVPGLRESERSYLRLVVSNG